MKNMLLSFFLVAIISGCNSNVTQPIDYSNKNLLLKTYSSVDANHYTEYFYTTSYKISEVVRVVNEGENTTNYTYNGQDNIIRENLVYYITDSPEHSYRNYEYNHQGLLLMKSAFLLLNDGEYDFRSYKTFEYDLNNNIISYSIYNPEDIKVKYFELFYDNSGNVIETNFYQNGELSFNNKYEYDNKNNPYRKTSTNTSAFSISSNNIIKNEYTNFMMDGETQVKVYSYEYNENGYPISYTYDSVKLLFEYY